MFYRLLAALYNRPDNLPNAKAEDNLQSIFNTVLALAGVVAVAYIVFSGIKFAMSQGDSAKVKEARDGILYSVIGLMIVMISFVIINFVIGNI